MRYLKTGILLMIISCCAAAQPVDWKWGKKLAGTFPSLQGTDILGNITGTMPYQRSITVGDTCFSHNYYVAPKANCALFDWDRNGEMIRLTDFHTVENKGIYEFFSVSDERLNLYMACRFYVRMFTGDTVINHGTVPRIMEPEICVAKLSPSRQPEWIRKLSGFGGDLCFGFGAGDSGLVLATYHYSALYPNRLLLLGGDTLTPDTSTMLITQADTNGNPIKSSQLRSLDNYIYNVLFSKAPDGRFYLSGNTRYGIIFSGDTIFGPSYPQFGTTPFLITISGGGSVTDIGFLPCELEPDGMAITRSGYRCYTSNVSGSFTLGSDTITLPYDSLASIIFCTDSLNVLQWHHLLKYKYSAAYPPDIRITGFGDSIAFTTQCSGDFDFAGMTFHAGDSARLLTGVLDHAGNMPWHFLSDPVKGIQPAGILTDRCGNFILSGILKGTFIFGQDTLFNASGTSMGFLAKIERYPPAGIDLGPDTVACESYLLSAPPGFSHYCWNNGLSWEPELAVSHTGMYHLQAWNNEACYAEDSVLVTIWNTPCSGIADTALFYQDTIILNVASPYEKIRWSGGDTGQHLTIVGAQLQPGINTFWVEMTNGPCIAADTFRVTMKYHQGTSETGNGNIRIYPNPSQDRVCIVTDHLNEPAEITVTNVCGQIVKRFVQQTPTVTLDISDWASGIYLFRIRNSSESNVIRFIRN